MEISRELAIQILKYCDEHKDFYFPFLVVHKETYLEPCDYRKISNNKKYQTFRLHENLQHLYLETVELMSRGFIEKITKNVVN